MVGLREGGGTLENGSADEQKRVKEEEGGE